MGIKRKAKIAWSVLLSDGPAQFGKRMLSNLKSVLKREIEPNECEIVSRILQPSRRCGVMIDIGAHHGAVLDDYVTAGWRVVAFEPDARTRQTLERVYGQFDNLSIDPRGISDKAQNDVPFYTSNQSTGISGLLPFDRSHELAGTVSTTTLEWVIREFGLSGIDFLKIDTEGFDLLVLRGLPDEVVPDVIVCEFEDRKTRALGYYHTDLADELQRRGYTVVMSEWYPVEAYGRAHRWRRVAEWPAKLLDADGWGNFVAVTDRATAERVLAAFPSVVK